MNTEKWTIRAEYDPERLTALLAAAPAARPYGERVRGLVTALQVLAVVQQLGRPVSEVCRRFEPVPQLLRNVRTGAASLERSDVKTAIADGEGRLAGSGRLLIRPSGTEPVIRVMAEGDDPALVESVVGDIVNALSGAAA